MDEPEAWRTSRYFTSLVVLIAHLTVLAAWMCASRGVMSQAPAPRQAVQVMVFSSSAQPGKRRPEVHPPRLSGAMQHWVTITTLDAPSLPPVSQQPESGAGGTGAGPDWNAEARRAVQAYEIRSRLPPPENLISGSPGDDRWWRRAPHKAGDRYKTPSGDWVVWITPRCYQVATAAAQSASPLPMPETVCPEESKN